MGNKERDDVTTQSSDELTHDVFLAVLVNQLQNPGEVFWLWLCLNDEEKKRQLDQAGAYFQEWKANELLRQDQSAGEHVTANEWRRWFISERLELHDALAECLENSVDARQMASALCEHDISAATLTQHAVRQVIKADLVSVLAVRCEASSG